VKRQRKCSSPGAPCKGGVFQRVEVPSRHGSFRPECYSSASQRRERHQVLEPLPRARYLLPMVTTLESLDTSYAGTDSPPQTTSTTTAPTLYDVCWAASGCGCDWHWGVSAAPQNVVVDDRLAANPINRRDPSGLILVQSKVKANEQEAGAFEITYNFQLENNAPHFGGGYIVQLVTYNVSWGYQGEREHPEPPITYLEAWYVEPDTNMVKGRAGWPGTDQAIEDAHYGPNRRPTHGTASQTTVIRFFTVTDLVDTLRPETQRARPLGDAAGYVGTPPDPKSGFGMPIYVNAEGTQVPYNEPNAIQQIAGASANYQQMSWGLPSMTLTNGRPPQWWDTLWNRNKYGETEASRSVTITWDMCNGKNDNGTPVVSPPPSDKYVKNPPTTRRATTKP
jgi:hypothetical protein